MKQIFTKFAFALIAALLYGYVFGVLFNYDIAWMNPEKFGVHSWILSNGQQLKLEDAARSLNIDVIEVNESRMTRPVSNFLEVINVKFRANLWNELAPHPAVSLLWPLMFIVLPIVLFRFFVVMGCEQSIALIGVLAYLSSVGFLGPLVMLFHPAKNLVNVLAAIILLFMATHVRYKKDLSLPSCLMLLGLFMLMFLSDETGLYVYAIVLAIFIPELIAFKDKTKWFITLSILPIIYGLTVKIFLPWLHWVVRGKQVVLSQYESYPSIGKLFWPDWSIWMKNFTLLFGDHPHLNFEFLHHFNDPVVVTIEIIYWIIMIFIGYLVIKSLRSNKVDRHMLRFVLTGILLMLGYVFFHTFQLSKNAKIWGIWWYGSLFSLIYVITLTFTLQMIAQHLIKVQRWLWVIALVLVMQGLMFSTLRITMFKKQNLDRNNFKFEEIFNGHIDQFDAFDLAGTFKRSQCKQLYTQLLWSKAKAKKVDVNPQIFEGCKEAMQEDQYFQFETLYLPIELGVK